MLIKALTFPCCESITELIEWFYFIKMAQNETKMQALTFVVVETWMRSPIEVALDLRVNALLGLLPGK